MQRNDEVLEHVKKHKALKVAVSYFSPVSCLVLICN